jgi:hypothetical protein
MWNATTPAESISAGVKIEVVVAAVFNAVVPQALPPGLKE